MYNIHNCNIIAQSFEDFRPTTTTHSLVLDLLHVSMICVKYQMKQDIHNRSSLDHSEFAGALSCTS